MQTTIKVEVRKVTAENKQSYFRTCYAHDCRWQRRTHWLEVQVGKGNSPPPGCSVVKQCYLSVWAHSNSQTTEKRIRASLKRTKPFNDFPFPKCKNQSFHGLEGHTWPGSSLSLTSFPTTAALADSHSALFDIPLIHTTLALPELLYSQAPQTETLFPTYLCALNLRLNVISSEVFPVHS